MTSVGFEPAILATKRQHTYALDSAGNRIGYTVTMETYNRLLNYRIILHNLKTNHRGKWSTFSSSKG
jgi:hypothetical protein